MPAKHTDDRRTATFGGRLAGALAVLALAVPAQAVVVPQATAADSGPAATKSMCATWQKDTDTATRGVAQADKKLTRAQRKLDRAKAKKSDPAKVKRLKKARTSAARALRTAQKRLKAAQASTVPQRECDALLAIKKANPDAELKNWGGKARPCAWKGVTCTAGRVTALTLPDNEIPVLPKQIGDLTALVVLNLSGSSVEMIPAALGSLPSLETLLLDYNEIEGDVSAWAKPLSLRGKVTRLTLEGNYCLTTADTDLATWIAGLDAAWNDGCEDAE